MSLIFNLISVGFYNCLLIFLLIIVGNITSCISDDVSQPDIFSFKVNGRLIKAEDNDWKSGGPTSGTIKADTILYLSGINTVEDYEGVYFEIINFSGIGKYTLSETSKNTGVYIKGSVKYYTNNTYQGTVIIKQIMDTPPTRISGTFSFSVIDDVSGEIYEISEGQFNIPFRTIE